MSAAVSEADMRPGRMRGRLGGAAFAAVLGLSPLALLGLSPAGATPSCTGTSTVTCSFGFTGAADSFTVPAGVTSVTVDAKGAGGGAGGGGEDNHAPPRAAGGAGAEVVATISVTPCSTLPVNVGGLGTQG